MIKYLNTSRYQKNFFEINSLKNIKVFKIPFFFDLNLNNQYYLKIVLKKSYHHKKQSFLIYYNENLYQINFKK